MADDPLPPDDFYVEDEPVEKVYDQWLRSPKKVRTVTPPPDDPRPPNAHVDFIANDWFNAKQRRLAIVRLGDDGTVVEQRGDGVEPSLLAGFPSLEAVVAKFNRGSYFFASEVHDEAECPWPENDLIRMKPVPLDGESDPARRAT